MNYWIDKDERAKLAIEHTSIVAQKYKDDIINCINKTIIYGGPDKKPEKPEVTRGFPSLIFDNCLSQEAVFKYTKDDDKVAVLNFASYKGPGGGFIKGSRAQEEMLCHYSFLYNVIKEQKNYYEWNNEHKNRALYLDRALYTPQIKFFDNLQNTELDVISQLGTGHLLRWKYRVFYFGQLTICAICCIIQWVVVSYNFVLSEVEMCLMTILAKKQMSEEDIKLQYITPAILSKWNKNRITMKTKITDGKICLNGIFVQRDK